MEFENEPTDEQLDALLQNIEIPSDLKSQLKQIPSQQELAEPTAPLTVANSQTANKSNRNWMTYVLAASLIGIGLFIAAQYWPTGNGKTPNDNFATNDTPDETRGPDSSTETPKQTEFEIAMAEFQEGQMQLDAAIHAIEIAQLESQLLTLERSTSIQIDQNEIESVIAAMSQQYSVPLGVSQQKIESGMDEVIELFPGTRGAKIAYEFLETETQ